MLPPRPLRWYDALVLIAGYVVLDWASYLHPLHGLNITPWNPAPALVLVFMLRFGTWAAAPTVVAILLAESSVRGLPIDLPTTIGLATLLTLGYWGVATLLSRQIVQSSFLSDRTSFFAWALIISIGTLVNSALFVGTLHLAGYVPADDIRTAIHRYWVGDAAGVLIAMPLLWMLLTDRGRFPPLRQWLTQRDLLAQVGITLGALWVAFGIGEQIEPRYLYALFLPVAWSASRNGLPGTVMTITVIQVGIIAAVKWHQHPALTLLEVQLLAAVIALFGLFIALVVEEKERLSMELRQTLRLAAAGEMAGALAHELNQPLTALSTYGSACELLLQQGETGPRLQTAVAAMVGESFRAANVLRRLREFFQSGATRLEPVVLRELVAAALETVATRAARESVRIAADDLPDCRLYGDRLQLEVVLRNLLANALDACSVRPPGERRVTLRATVVDTTRVHIDVEDNGNGVDPAQLAGLFDGFQSTKSSGLGLGLFISRSIAEAHGGSLNAEPGEHGCFRLTLPIEDNTHAH